MRMMERLRSRSRVLRQKPKDRRLKRRKTHIYKEKTMEPNTTTHGANGASPPPGHDENGWLLTGPREIGVIDHEMLEEGKAIEADAERLVARVLRHAALGREMHDVHRDNDIEAVNEKRDLTKERDELIDKVTRLEAKDWFEEALRQEARAEKAEAALAEVRKAEPTPVVVPEPAAPVTPPKRTREEQAELNRKGMSTASIANARRHEDGLTELLKEGFERDESAITLHRSIFREAVKRGLLKDLSAASFGFAMRYIGETPVVVSENTGDGRPATDVIAWSGIKVKGESGQLADEHVLRPCWHLQGWLGSEVTESAGDSVTIKALLKNAAQWCRTHRHPKPTKRVLTVFLSTAGIQVRYVNSPKATAQNVRLAR